MSSYIQVDDRMEDNNWWIELLRSCASLGEHFWIMCWADEAECARGLLRYGTIVPNAWQGGIMIEGTITREFLCFLGAQPKPLRSHGYNKMTPFFTIRLGDTLASEHYGTEISIINAPPQSREAIERILKSLERTATVHRDV